MAFLSFSQQSEITSRTVIDYKNHDLVDKISPDLLLLEDLYQDFLSGKINSFEHLVPLCEIRDDLVNIQAVSRDANGKLLEDELRNLGVINTTSFKRIINGWIPIYSIRFLADLDHLQFATVAYKHFLRTGSVTSQGDTALRGPQARSTNSVDGSGVTVGVLSDSYDDLNGAAGDITSGDLPSGGVNCLDNGPGGGSDEGRAMLQIVHDVAPGADLAFHTASGGLAVFAQGILDLEAAGCEVIVDDIGYPNDAFFQDGIVAQAADSVTSNGNAYLSAAGNDAQQSYEGTYTAGNMVMIGGFPYTTHDFDPGIGVDDFQSITIPNDGFVTISLQWENPFFSISGPPGGTADIDLFLYSDPPGPNPLASSVINNIGGDALEIIQFQNTGPTANFNIVIALFSGTAPNMVKWIALGDLLSVNDFPTNSATCFAHPNAAGAMASGASFWFFTPEYGTNPPVLNSFSSRGGTPILFDTNGNSLGSPVIRMKPDFTAPDGGDNTFFGADNNDVGSFPNFFGTSAAAPHAAGVVALMFDSAPPEPPPLHSPSLAPPTPAEIRQALQSSSIDIPPSGFDNDSGSGLIQADAAIAALTAVLPIELVSFEVFKEGRDAILKWSTAIETDNYGFEIEHSMNPVNDASDLEWTKVDFIHAGLENSSNEYDYVMENLIGGIHYFRLKQIDLSGAVEYSPIRSLKFESEFPVVVFYNRENKTIEFDIGISGDDKVDFDIYDTLGRLLLRTSSPLIESSRIEIPANGLGSGVLFYRISIGNDTHSGKIIIAG